MGPWRPRGGTHGIPGWVAHGIPGEFPTGSQGGPLGLLEPLRTLGPLGPRRAIGPGEPIDPGGPIGLGAPVHGPAFKIITLIFSLDDCKKYQERHVRQHQGGRHPVHFHTCLITCVSSAEIFDSRKQLTNLRLLPHNKRSKHNSLRC